MTTSYFGCAVSLSTCVLSGLVILAKPGLAPAQTPVKEIFQEQADSLRLQLVCQPDSAWPDLPRRPEATSIEAKVDSTGALSYLAGGGVVVSTTVQLPQYAYFFNPTSEACEPVIVLGADASGSFIYTRPAAKTAGAAPVVFFNLLGEDPPKLSEPSTESDSDPDSDPGSESG